MSGTEPKRRGRPPGSKNKTPPEVWIFHRNLEVWDMRAALGGPRLLAKHKSVPMVSDKELLERFGIGAHLRAVLIQDHETFIIQEGSR